MATYEAKVDALNIAFVELAKFLGREQVLPVLQLATALNDAAKPPRASVETAAAVSSLAESLRR